MAKGKYEYWLTADGLTLLEAWARDGATLDQIAAKCGITRETLHQWRGKYPDISDALKKGQEVVDIQVENALLKRALGYEYDETMTEEGTDGIKRRVTRKMVVPDVTAQIYWLKNRKPGVWRDRPDEVKQTDTSLMEALLKVVSGND